MANNRSPWRGNTLGHNGPLLLPGAFLAGASVPVKRGELLILTSTWTPIAADAAFAANVAIAAEEIKNGDKAGKYMVIVPQPGDIFEFELATANAISLGTLVYFSTSQKVTVTDPGGGHALGASVGDDNYPLQGHSADDASGDAGTTLRVVSSAKFMFDISISYFSALNIA